MIVVKAGGASGVDGLTICRDIATLVQGGEHVILVHGGSQAIEHLGAQLGYQPRFLTAVSGVQSRYTDPQALEVLTMALAGQVKPRLVAQLQQLGVGALGLTGIDGALLCARRKSAIKVRVGERIQVVHDDLSGQLTGINTTLLTTLLQAGLLPVVSPPAFDETAGPLNVDADRVAAAIAVAMHAEHLVLLSNVPGVLRDVNDATSLIERVSAEQVDQCLACAQGRMRIKVIAARQALSGGVRRVILGDGRLPCPVLQALDGQGTVLYADDGVDRRTCQASSLA
jgi:acetylglutamate/LysW-gamma-L-alpha-aminoadipate kinase